MDNVAFSWERRCPSDGSQCESQIVGRAANTILRDTVFMMSNLNTVGHFSRVYSWGPSGPAIAEFMQSQNIRACGCLLKLVFSLRP